MVSKLEAGLSEVLHSILPSLRVGDMFILKGGEDLLGVKLLRSEELSIDSPPFFLLDSRREGG